jgi:hypothetical protein
MEGAGGGGWAARTPERSERAIGELQGGPTGAEAVPGVDARTPEQQPRERSDSALLRDSLTMWVEG